MNATGGVDTALTCTRADAHSSRAHITVHISVIDPHSSNVVTSALARDTKDQRRAFLKNIVTSSSCVCQVFLSFVSLLSLHILLDLCHDPQRHRVRWRRPDQPPCSLECRAQGTPKFTKASQNQRVEPPATIDLVFCFSRGSCCFAEDLVVCLRMARRNMVVCGWPMVVCLRMARWPMVV